ncbi:hypothetical protein L2E82_30848 [Cichorium intybus]|uniref:Uncharacterized protein n=1 Tax=Cichorium intybus TaxID=13427 RepID=A0ACB9D1H6_CICIN|nr:hypothetical protein L2E82_30848 [Cichorium intybus]
MLAQWLLGAVVLAVRSNRGEGIGGLCLDSRVRKEEKVSKIGAVSVQCRLPSPGYDSRKRTLSLTKSGVLAGISSPLADAGGPSPYTIRDSKLDWCSVWKLKDHWRDNLLEE